MPIVTCTCRSKKPNDAAAQMDANYGPQRRVANLTRITRADRPQARCVVCSTLHSVSKEARF